MIKGRTGIPTIAMKFEDENMPDVHFVQVAADSQIVTVAYLNLVGTTVDVKGFAVEENPELNNIVKFHYFDDVWDMEMLLSLVEPVQADEPACDFTPKWRFKQWQPTTEPDFRNPPAAYQVAS